MVNNKFQELEESIRNASPLELASVLQEAELYDKKETRKVVDEVYEEFKTSGNLIDEVVIPVFMSIADGFLESTAATRKLRKKGLTASRIVSQCQSFSYDKIEKDTIIPDGYTEWKNVGDQTRSDFQHYGEEMRQAYNREAYEDKKRLDAYKQKSLIITEVESMPLMSTQDKRMYINIGIILMLVETLNNINMTIKQRSTILCL